MCVCHMNKRLLTYLLTYLLSYMKTCLCHNVVSKRKPWTDAEREAILRHLQPYVLRSVLPRMYCVVGILFSWTFSFREFLEQNEYAVCLSVLLL